MIFDYGLGTLAWWSCRLKRDDVDDEVYGYENSVGIGANDYRDWDHFEKQSYAVGSMGSVTAEVPEKSLNINKLAPLLLLLLSFFLWLL